MGWHLGVDSVSLSYRDPFNKFVSRVHEVAEGRAPAATAIIMYSQGAVPVISYVSQFALPHHDARLPELGQWSLQKEFRTPPKSMPRELCHSAAFCAEVGLVCFSACCSANLHRFAESESDNLLQLHAKVTDIRSVCPRVDNTTLSSIPSPAYGSNMYDLPSGGLSDPPFFAKLFNATELFGPLFLS